MTVRFGQILKNVDAPVREDYMAPPSVLGGGAFSLPKMMPKSIILFDDNKYHSIWSHFGMQNYYQILEVEPNASFEKIKAAYRKKALQCHPDRGGSHAEMVRINEAWEILSNQTLRQQYDEMLRTGQSKPEQFKAARDRSKNYERDWSKFDSWLSSIGKDFTSAEYGSKKYFGTEMPTASGSISAKAFLVSGGAVGFLLWLAISILVISVWYSGSSKDKNYHATPVLARVALFTSLASVAAGAGCGRWMHQKFGALISSWLPREMPSSLLARITAKDSRRKKPSGSKAIPDDSSRIANCPQCKQKLRLPTKAEALKVTCPKCETEFNFPNQNNQQERNGMKFPPNKASLATLLRCLLIFEIVFGVIALSVGMFVVSIGDQILADAGLASQDMSMVGFAMLVVALLMLLPMAIVSWVGLFQHKNWGRWLYLIGLVAAQLVNVFAGCLTWTYSWDLVTALHSIGYLTSGIILAICFLSPLATEFNSENHQ